MDGILGRTRGFSLVEMIVVLIIVGIIAAAAGTGLLHVVEGMLFTRTNADTVQKGQIAIAKLVKEFNNISYVIAVATNAGSITFSAYKEGSPAQHTVTFSGGAITFDGDIVTDQVSSFELGYYDTYTSAKQTTWSAMRRIIEITIGLSGSDGVVSQFKARITPRNL